MKTIIAFPTLLLFLIACTSSESSNPVAASPESSEISSSIGGSSSSTADTNTEQSSATELSSSSTPAVESSNILDDMSTADGSLSGSDGLWFADADIFSGGNSQTLDPNGKDLVSAIPGCGKDGLLDGQPCYSGWNIKNGDAYEDGALTVNLIVTDWVPSSAAGWGWASAGLVLQPKGGFGDTVSAGLRNNDTLGIVLSYTAGEKLNIEIGLLPGEYDESLSSPPRLASEVGGYTGTGVRDTLRVAIANFGPSWGKADFDPGKTWRILFNRMIAASTQGQNFPSSEPSSTQLKIWCIDMSGGCR